LVAFFGGPHFQVNIGIGAPVVGWVALGWGEPCVPWWGRPGFIRRPWWGGWGGPRIVNNVVVQRTTVVRVEEIHVYRNAHVQNAVVAVHRDRFGHHGVAPSRIPQVNVESLRPLPTAPEVRTRQASVIPSAHRATRPPEKDLKRPVVATRPPHLAAHPADREERKSDATPARGQDARIVPAPQPRKNAETLPRPPFGQSRVERRPEADHARQPLPPKSENLHRRDLRPVDPPRSVEQLPQTSKPSQRPERSERIQAESRSKQAVKGAPPSAEPAPKRIEEPRAPVRQLPGEPASRLSPNRTESVRPQQIEHRRDPAQLREHRQPPSELRRPHGTSDNNPAVQPPAARPSSSQGVSGGKS
jgi:hypothetical protein